MTSTATESDRTTNPDVTGHLGIITVNYPSGAPFAVGDRVVVLHVADTYYSVTRINDSNLSTEGTWVVNPSQVNLLPQPEVGSTYTVNKDRPRSAGLSTGDRVIVIRPYEARDHRAAWIVNREGRPDDFWVSTDDLDIPVPTTGTGTTVPDPVPATPDPRDAEIETLRSRVADLERRNVQMRTTWEAENTALGNLLMREADNRNWCSEYDEIVAKANRDLTYPLPNRVKEIDISWTEEYTVTVTRHACIETTEGNEESDAVSYMENGAVLGEADLIQLLRENGSHEYQWQEFGDWAHA